MKTKLNPLTMTRKINWLYALNGLVLFAVGMLLFINRAPVFEVVAGGEPPDFVKRYLNPPYEIGGLSYDELMVWFFILLFWLAGVRQFQFSLQYPEMKGYPVWFMLLGVATFTFAGIYGYHTLAAAEGNAEAIQFHLLVLLFSVLVGCVGFLGFTFTFRKELGQARHKK